MGKIKLTCSERKVMEILALNTNSSGVITYSILRPVMKVQEEIKVHNSKMSLEAIKNGKRHFCCQYIEMLSLLEQIEIAEIPADKKQINEMLETKARQNTFSSLLAKGIISSKENHYIINDMNLLPKTEPYKHIQVVEY